MHHRHRFATPRTALFLGLSLLLHGLFILLLHPPPAEEYPPHRFRAQWPTRFARLQSYLAVRPQLPAAAPERLEAPPISESSAPIGPLEIPPAALPAPPLPDSELAEIPAVAVKTDSFELAAEQLPDLNELALDAMRRAIEERKGHLKLQLPDAEVSEADFHSRLKARRVVERALQAMGGFDSLLAIRQLRIKVWIQSTQDQQGGAVVAVPPYVYPVEYWHGSGLDRFVETPIRVELSLDPARPNPTYALRNPPELSDYRALFTWRWAGVFNYEPRRSRFRRNGEKAQWHFVDRFFGASTELGYLVAERFGNEAVETVRVENRQFGNFSEAFFSRQSGLLYAVREGLSAAEQKVWKRHNLGKEPPIWTTVYRRYENVDGILTPTVLERWKNNGLALIVHLRVAYNEDVLDESAPPVWEGASSKVKLPKAR